MTDKRLPLVLPACEIPLPNLGLLKECEPRLTCTSFLEAKAALEREGMAALLPDFLVPNRPVGAFLTVRLSALDACGFQYRLAWNPRLLRLNPHARRQRDFLIESLRKQFQSAGPAPVA